MANIIPIGPVALQRNVTYKNQFGDNNLVVWEADPWQETSLSWKKSVYVHAGISGFKNGIKGPDAQKLLSRISINDVYHWEMNRTKHLVMCDENGYIVNHAATQRDGETEFTMYSGNPWPLFKEFQMGEYDCEITTENAFVFQMSGPLSLTLVEKMTGENQRDVRFLDVKRVRIIGVEGEYELCRIGMSGTLAYEFRGPAEKGPEIYDLICKAGEEYDLKRLGWKTYTVNHFEGGYPQMTVGFITAALIDPIFQSVPELMAIGSQEMTGSIDPERVEARLRNPVELDWSWMTDWDHDFIGKEALKKEADAPRRKVVNLEWNVDDIMEIYKSHFEEGEDYKVIEFPCAVPQPAGGHADLVTDADGNEIGISSATTYSYYYRKLMSQCVLNVDEAELGNEVIVHWGDYGKRIMKVRAKVVRYPYIDLPDNKDYDLSTVPFGFQE